MYGVYLVPTGNLFRFFEVSAPIGYSHLRLKNSNGHVNFDAVSFGLNFRSDEHTSELQSLMRISYAVFCLKKKKYPTELPNINFEKTQHTQLQHIRSSHLR